MAKINLNQTYRFLPKLDFSSNLAQEGYVPSQHTDNNYIKQNALNAVKFNEFERLFYDLYTIIGPMNDSFFTTYNTLGSAIAALNQKVNSLGSITGAESILASYHLLGTGGGKVFVNPINTTNSNDVYKEFDLSIAHDALLYQFSIETGFSIIGTNESAKNKVSVYTSREVTTPEYGCTTNSLIGDSEAIIKSKSKDQYTLTSSGTVYLNNKYIKTVGYTLLANNPSVVFNVLGDTTLYKATTDFSVDYINGIITIPEPLLTNILGGQGSKVIEVIYFYHRYKKVISYINSNNDSIQFKETADFDTWEEANNSTEFFNLNEETPVTIDISSDSFKNANTLLYQFIISPKNSLYEFNIEWEEGFNSLDETNIYDSRIDITTNIKKFEGFSDSVINLSIDNLLNDYNEGQSAANRFKVNILPHYALINGRLIYVNSFSDSLVSIDDSNHDRCVALSYKYDGTLSLTSVVTAAENGAASIPDVKAGYNFNGVIFYIPKGTTKLSDCLVYINSHDSSKHLIPTNINEINFYISLKDDDYLESLSIPTALLTSGTIYKDSLVRILNGDFGDRHFNIDILNYEYLGNDLPSHIKDIYYSTGISIPASFTLKSGHTLHIYNNLSLSYTITLESNTCVRTYGSSTISSTGNIFTGSSVSNISLFVNCSGTQNILNGTISNSNLDIRTSTANTLNATLSECVIKCIGASLILTNAGSNNIYNNCVLASGTSLGSNYIFGGKINNIYKSEINGFINVDSTGQLAHNGNLTLGTGNITISFDNINKTFTFGSEISFVSNGVSEFKKGLKVSTDGNFDIDRPALFSEDIKLDGESNKINLNSKKLAFDDSANVYMEYSTDVDGVTGNGATGVKCQGHFAATEIYNAYWNDIADFQKIDYNSPKIPGKCYVYNDDGLLTVSSSRCQSGTVGIYSDTYGIGIGYDTKEEIPIAVGGWVLAYIDKKYKSGTPLVSSKNGYLTKANLIDKLFFQERIVGIFGYTEEAEIIGTKDRKVKVDNRFWIKVK